jgi:hypothetical protein
VGCLHDADLRFYQDAEQENVVTREDTLYASCDIAQRQAQPAQMSLPPRTQHTAQMVAAWPHDPSHARHVPRPPGCQARDPSEAASLSTRSASCGWA